VGNIAQKLVIKTLKVNVKRWSQKKKHQSKKKPRDKLSFSLLVQWTPRHADPSICSTVSIKLVFVFPCKPTHTHSHTLSFI
jgi:hypothetical protein